MVNILDFIFPRLCVGCDQEGSWLCTDCYGSIDHIVGRGCPSCNPLVNGAYCCLHGDSILTGLVSVEGVHRGILRRAVHALKYEGVRELGQALGCLLKRQLLPFDLLADAQVVPIPLHWRRLHERGFNQAELIAYSLAPKIVCRALQRQRYTLPQVALNAERRRHNLRGAFIVKAKYAADLIGQRIILVDDVTTSGTTLRRAAELLKQLGAKEIWGATITRG